MTIIDSQAKRDHEFESAFLQRRVTNEPVPDGARRVVGSPRQARAAAGLRGCVKARGGTGQSSGRCAVSGMRAMTMKLITAASIT
jgi:hypothetical protein